MKALRIFACTLLLCGSFLSAAVQAQDLTLLDLLEGETITANDKSFSNWELDVGSVNFGDLNGIFVSPLEDNPLNPGLKFTIPNGLVAGGQGAVLHFRFDVQTTSGEALIKDNSLWLNGFSFPAGSSGQVIIRESISDASGLSLGFKDVVAMAGDIPDSGNPAHFDSAEFAPQSFVHVEKIIEVFGEGTALTMFEQRFSQVPEPGSMTLLAIGFLTVGLWKGRRNRQASAGGRPVKSRLATKSLLIATLFPAVLLSIGSAASGGTAKFTASTPPGGTNSPHLISFSVAVSGGPSFTSLAGGIELAAGVTGHDVVSEMEFQMEDRSSVEGDVSGNMLTVQNVSSATVTGGGGELDLWLDLDTMLDPCRGCALNVPFTFQIPPPPFDFLGDRTLVLTLTGADGQVVPIQSDGVFSLGLGFADDPVSPTIEFTFEGTWDFSPGMTTADLTQTIDTTLQTAAFPTGVEYLGLVGGFPMIAHDISMRMISIQPSTSVPDESDPGFLVGIAARGVIPEPASFVLLAIGLIAIGRVRFRRCQA